MVQSLHRKRVKRLTHCRAIAGRLRSQNIFLNFGGRSFGQLFDEGTLCGATQEGRGY